MRIRRADVLLAVARRTPEFTRRLRLTRARAASGTVYCAAL
jgi:hypothetical protein